MSTDEQNALVNQLKTGSEDAFSKFVKGFEKQIKGVDCRILKNTEEAEDIAQNVFIKVFQSIAAFRNESKLSSWVYRITLNEIFTHQRKAKKYSYQDFDDNNMSTSKWFEPEETVLNNELQKLLGDSLQTLKEKEKAVFVLRKIEEVAIDEVSSARKSSIPALKSQLWRGRQKLRDSKIGNYLRGEMNSVLQCKLNEAAA